jgi:transcriptional regulator GlxA family with amidase domain
MSEDQLPEVVLAVWRHAARDRSHAVVLPDGCCDLIGRTNDRGCTRWFLSTLSETAYAVGFDVGERFVGFRLRPGTRVASGDLLAALHGRAPSYEQLLARVEDCCRLDTRLAEALACLEQARTVAMAASEIGVSARSLGRLVADQTGRSPSYWKGLARVRRAARALRSQEPLADLALEHGYADQAHLSRDIRRWFGLPPTALRRRADLLATLQASGYG